MDNNDNNSFSYTYTAPNEKERREVETIRRRYSEKNSESKLERLHKLDAKVRNSAMIAGLAFGVTGVLVFGFGLTCVLEWSAWTWGIICMAVGCVPIALAYPAHNAIYSRNRKKYSAEIIRLSDEILAEDNAK